MERSTNDGRARTDFLCRLTKYEQKVNKHDQRVMDDYWPYLDSGGEPWMRRGYCEEQVEKGVC